MSDPWQNLTPNLITMLGLGAVILLVFTMAYSLWKNSSVLLTWMWMVLFAIGTGIVMLVLLFLFQRKSHPRYVNE
jgi:O-antigen/teichoic acid export membrane protein